jgi:hypothetical protein
VIPSTVLRERTDGTAPRVTNMELFFDFACSTASLSFLSPAAPILTP